MVRRPGTVLDEVDELRELLDGVDPASRAAFVDVLDGLAMADRTGAAILAHGLAIASQHGIRAVTLAEICGRSRVGRATVYRRWDSVDELRNEIVRIALSSERSFESSGSLWPDLMSGLSTAALGATAPGARQAFLNLIEAISSRQLEADRLADALQPLRRRAAAPFVAAVERGDISEDDDLNFLVACLQGPTVLKLLLEHRPLTETERHLVAAFCHRVATAPPLPQTHPEPVATIQPLIRQIETGLAGIALVDEKRAEVLRSAMRLLLVEGVSRLTIDQLVSDCGVSKATIYERWNNVDEIVTEFALLALLNADTPLPSDNPSEEIHRWLHRVPMWSGSPPVVGALATMCHALTSDPERSPVAAEGAAVWAQVVAGVLQRAADRGQASPHIELDTLVCAIIGPIFMMLMAGGTISDANIVRLANAAGHLIANYEGLGT